MAVEFVERNIENPITVFDVWKEILTKHPEIVRQTIKLYVNHPHGQTVDQTIEVLPRERILWSDSESGFYGNDRLTKAIGARVEVLPEDFDPEIDYSWAERWFDGEHLEISKDRERSLIFVDFESNPTPKTTDMIVNTMSKWNTDWYLLDSGGSYHLVIPILAKLEQLPIYYGGLIRDFSKNLSPPRNQFFSAIGGYLIENFRNRNNLRLWNREIIKMVGHIESAHLSGDYVFPMDLRYIAHVLDALVEDDKNEGYLRVGSKHGSVPVLVDKRVGHFVLNYKYQNSIFERKQIPLPEV